MRLLRGYLLRALMIAALGLLGVSTGAAETRPQGLLWRDSPLPAVFPLQIKSHAGEDYYMRLVDVTTDKTVLAAYVRGGQFFRVLVPPGTFHIRFAAGDRWRGEDQLFGSGDSTRLFEMPKPLTFGVRNFSTKGGHLIDLSKTGPGEVASIAPLETCQTLQLVRRDHDRAQRVGRHSHGKLRLPKRFYGHTARSRLVKRFDRFRFEVRTAQCGAYHSKQKAAP